MKKYSLRVYACAMLKRNSAVFAYIVGRKKNQTKPNQPPPTTNKTTKIRTVLHGNTQIIYLRFQDLNTVLLNCFAETKSKQQQQQKRHLTEVAILAIWAYALNAMAENGSSHIMHVKISELQEVLPRDTYVWSVCIKYMHAFLRVQPMC